jgi:hypothetical protein
MYVRSYQLTLASVETFNCSSGRAIDDAAPPRLDAGALQLSEP